MTLIDEKYLCKINEFPNGCAFRGQADSSWKLHSGATRRLIKHHRDIIAAPNFSQIYASYHSDVLIKPARTNGFDIDDGYQVSDLQLLAKLQHFEAATGLLDFTWNPLVALWFACKDNEDYDGNVFVVDLRNPLRFQQVPSEMEKQSVKAIFLPGSDAGKLLYWEAKIHGEAATRILRQRSVFVIGRPLIPKDVVQHIEIKASDKGEIRKELEDVFDISERTLFMDIHGFSVANNSTAPVDQINDPNYYLFLGNQSYQQGNYPQAIDSYDNCISLAPNVSETYFLRGNAKAELTNLPDALEDYNFAIQNKDRPFLNLSPNSRIIFNPILPLIYFNRGNIKAEMNDYEGALADYDEALRLGPEDRNKFFNRANIKVILQNFDNAIDDYNDAIRLGSPAHFNKANTLVILGRFEEALEYYEHAVRGNIDSQGILNNLQSVIEIIALINGAHYEKDIEQIETPQDRLIITHVRVESTYFSERGFIFKGNKGNTGNFNINLPGGKGFSGDNGFVVLLSSSQQQSPSE